MKGVKQNSGGGGKGSTQFHPFSADVTQIFTNVSKLHTYFFQAYFWLITFQVLMNASFRTSRTNTSYLSSLIFIFQFIFPAIIDNIDCRNQTLHALLLLSELIRDTLQTGK